MKEFHIAINTHSGWVFLLLWIVAGYVGGLLYVIPVSAVQFVLGLQNLSEPQQIAAASRPFVVLSVTAVAAACGISIGFFQWLVLRRDFERTGLWVAATTVGFASLGVWPLLIGVWQPEWPDWAFTLILDGKFSWLARLVPEWPLASWPAGVVTLAGFGAVSGVVQWLVLSRHVRRAGYWILFSTVAWAAGGLLSGGENNFWAVSAAWNIPLLVTALGLLWLRSSRVADIQTMPGQAPDPVSRSVVHPRRTVELDAPDSL